MTSWGWHKIPTVPAPGKIPQNSGGEGAGGCLQFNSENMLLNTLFTKE